MLYLVEEGAGAVSSVPEVEKGFGELRFRNRVCTF